MSPATRAALLGGAPVAVPASRDPAGPLQERAAGARAAGDKARLVVLMRVQRRLAVRTLSLTFATLFALPLLLSVLPDLTHVRLLGVPVVWIGLGVGVYPLLAIAGWLHVRRAEQVEDELAGSP